MINEIQQKLLSPSPYQYGRAHGTQSWPMRYKESHLGFSGKQSFSNIPSVFFSFKHQLQQSYCNYVSTHIREDQENQNCQPKLIKPTQLHQQSSINILLKSFFKKITFCLSHSNQNLPYFVSMESCDFTPAICCQFYYNLSVHSFLCISRKIKKCYQRLKKVEHIHNIFHETFRVTQESADKDHETENCKFMASVRRQAARLARSCV